MPRRSSKAEILLDVVRRAVDSADVEGLLRMGAPADEYDSEINMISARIDLLPSRTPEAIHDVVVQVWSKMFGPQPPDQRELRSVAEAIARALDDAEVGRG